MFLKTLRRLDSWCVSHQNELASDGMLKSLACEITLLGQTALLESDLDLHLAATHDVDALGNYAPSVERQFGKLLEEEGKTLDPHSREIWMPAETTTTTVFKGALVRGTVADPPFVLLSKALKAPTKNRNLIAEYLARGADSVFLELAEKYELDLEQFV